MRSLTLAVLSCTVVVSTARANSTVIVAPLEGLAVKAADTRRVQRWIEAAVAALPGQQLLDGARLQRLLARRGTPTDCAATPRCLGPLGRQAGAELVVAGEVGSLGGGYMVYLRLLHTGRHQTLRSVSGVLDPAGALRQAAAALIYRLILPAQYTGTLQVKVDVKDAWIYLNGRRLARSPEATLPNVPVGTHALRVTQERYRDFVRFVTVEFQQTTAVQVELSAFPVESAEMRLRGQLPLADRELPWYRRYWALTLTGVVLTAATAVVVALIPKGVRRDAEVQLR